MSIKIGDKVEIKDTGARLFVQHINENGYHLSISPEPGFVCVCVKQTNDICKVGTTRFVWIDPVEGIFSNSWETDSFITRDYMINMLDEYGWGNAKLVEFTCMNDDEFQFSHLMKLK